MNIVKAKFLRVNIRVKMNGETLSMMRLIDGILACAIPTVTDNVNRIFEAAFSWRRIFCDNYNVIVKTIS